MSIAKLQTATDEMSSAIQEEIKVSTGRFDVLLEAVKAMKEGLEEIEVAIMSERAERQKALAALIALPHQE